MGEQERKDLRPVIVMRKMDLRAWVYKFIRISRFKSFIMVSIWVLAHVLTHLMGPTKFQNELNSSYKHLWPYKLILGLNAN